MPYIKIRICCGWTSNRRVPLLTDSICPAVISHIRRNAGSKGIHINLLNGYREHLHAVVSLGVKQNICLRFPRIFIQDLKTKSGDKICLQGTSA